MLMGRQIAFMIKAFFRSQGRAIGMNDLLNIELRIDSLKIFDQGLRRDTDGDGKLTS